MFALRRLPVLFAVAALALIFAFGGSSFDDSKNRPAADASPFDEQLAELQNLQRHALPGSAEHYKYGHKINRILADRDGRPHQEHPELFAKMLYDRTVPADRTPRPDPLSNDAFTADCENRKARTSRCGSAGAGFVCGVGAAPEGRQRNRSRRQLRQGPAQARQNCEQAGLSCPQSWRE